MHWRGESIASYVETFGLVTSTECTECGVVPRYIPLGQEITVHTTPPTASILHLVITLTTNHATVISVHPDLPIRIYFYQSPIRKGRSGKDILKHGEFAK